MSTPSSPSQTCTAVTLKQDPVFLRSLLRLAGRKIDRRFYFSRLLPGAQRGRAGRRAACSYVLLRNSFSGKWGSFAQQRPLALSVRRLQRPPTNVTVRCQDALAHLRALPSQAPRHCIYADPPYIFPGRSMNYYGTRRRGHDLTFHSELRDALFASGLPFLLSINDVPGAWELYSRHHKAVLGQEQLQARAAGAASGQWPRQSCRQRRIEAAILWPTQDWQGPHQAHTRPAPGPRQARTRPAPGPRQARTRPAPGPHQARAAPGPHQARTRPHQARTRPAFCAQQTAEQSRTEAAELVSLFQAFCALFGRKSAVLSR